MAKIVPSSLAPSKPFRVVTALSSFEFDGSKESAHESNDANVLAEARVHPWLEVQMDEADVVAGAFKKSLDPEKDPLSAQHPDAKLAFDPEAARAAQPEAANVSPVAINAGLDQDEVVMSGPVAETVAASDKVAEDDEPKPKKAAKAAKDAPKEKN